jgi:hypothetical protein
MRGNHGQPQGGREVSLKLTSGPLFIQWKVIGYAKKNSDWRTSVMSKLP